jgi:inhibitor of KinA sporulation pathway (predicted exonuclease)
MHPTSDYEARVKRSEALLAAQEHRGKQYQEYYQRIEEDERRTQALIDRQEQANAHFEKILKTWEQQQREYQAYLDSLKRKPQ